jgi:hypothetical protein
LLLRSRPLAVLAPLITLVAGCAGVASQPAGEKSNPDDFLIVDCLLPGSVQQLGRSNTYVTARRPEKASALECKIRGGEYTSSDRADPAFALATWLPRAKEGDPEAQNYVGEIYERGVGLEPDYAAAASWYRRAAEQNFAPAQINLGQLHESGLGVARDRGIARDWYRRASGLPAGLEFLPSSPEGEIEALQARLAKVDAELERAREELAVGRREREAERLARPELEARITAARAQQRRTQAELDAALEARAELGRTRAELEAAREAYARLEQSREQLEAAIAARPSDAEIARLRAEVERLQRELDAAQQAPDLATLPGPSIRIIEPEMTPTRGVRVVSLDATKASRLLIGQVVAEAGLLRLLVNDLPHETNEEGIFEATLTATPEPSRVAIVAIDRVGRRAEQELLLRTDSKHSEESRAQVPAARPGIEFGRYHALVIANDDYEQLPDLATARNDGRAIADTLRSRFGFEVTLLEDANRYRILSALNALRERLTSDDNLLIYYAGHGQLDEVNQRGHWLPVDAERGSDANWISNVSITDILNAMNARHVIVISDSCYSGSLTRASLARLETGLTEQERFAWHRAMVSKRSRTALTSGGLAPVLDAGDGRHSVFARALLDVLSAVDDVLEGQRLYQQLAARVTYLAEHYRFEQVPQYAPIKFSGHESGDFFFVPRSS